MNGLEIETRVPAPAAARDRDDAAYKKGRAVLVAVDFSPDCEAALIWACDYAQTIGAPVEVLHVVHDPGDAPGSYKSENGDPLEPMTDVAQRKLAGFVDRIRQTYPDLPGLQSVISTCVAGLPASTILQVAQSRGACHLVLGGGRRKGVARFFHGSTTDQIAAKGQVAITIVKSDG